MTRMHRWGITAGLVVGLAIPAGVPAATGASDVWSSPSSIGKSAAQPAAAARPNIFFYNLDDLRDAFPGGVDPLQFMPKVRQWMAQGTRYTSNFVVDPACCPSRSSLMTGRYPHNNGVHVQADGPKFDFTHSMACYLRNAGYSTYMDGKFLTTWPRTKLPPCFQHSTVMWGGYNDVQMKTDGVSKKVLGYTTKVLGSRGRGHITSALAIGSPFLLYETPQAPHWANITNPDGTAGRLAVPEPKYANAPVGTCSGVPEADRSDKPAYVRKTNVTSAQGQLMCQSQIRAIMTADDEFGATMQLLSDRGVLSNTLVIFSSDNGYMWGEHGRTEKFVPYEPSLRVPLLVRWPGHVPAGTNSARQVTYLDLLPTILAAAGVTVPAGSPPLDGESLLGTSNRTTVYSEYYKDPADGAIDTWRMVRTPTVKYIQTYNPQGAVIFREYYNLTNDPAENTNLLGDSSTTNDPPPSQITMLAAKIAAFSTCSGANCVG